MKNIVVYNVGRIQLPVLPRPSSVGDAVVVALVGPGDAVVVALVGPQTLSAVVEPALISTVVALQVVQFAHANAFVNAEYFPDPQLLHTRSELFVPSVEIYWPVEQSDHD